MEKRKKSGMQKKKKMTTEKEEKKVDWRKDGKTSAHSQRNKEKGCEQGNGRQTEKNKKA